MPIEPYLAGVQGQRGAFPPTQVEDLQDAPRLLTDAEVGEERRKYLQGALKLAGVVAKPIGLGLSLSTRAIERLDDWTQITVATTFGRIPLKDYPRWMREVTHGQRTVTGSEWMRLMISQERWDAIKDTSLIPGWTKKLVVPDAYLGQVETHKPRVRLEDVANLGVELIVSPFAMLGFLPKSFFTATKVGKALAGPQIAKGVRLGVDPATSVVTLPLRKFAAAIFSRGPLGALLMHWRDPTEIYTGPMRSQLIHDAEVLHGAAEDLAERIIPLARKHKRGLIRNRQGLNQRELAAVWDDIHLADQQLDARQTALRDALWTDVIEPFYQMLERNGHAYVVKGGKRRVWNPTPGARVRHKPYLREFVGAVHSWRFAAQVRRAPSFRRQMETELPWIGKQGLPYNPAHLQDFQKDPFHAVESWASTVMRKVVLEAQERVRYTLPNGRTRLRWSPRGFLSLYRPPSRGRGYVEGWEDAVDAWKTQPHWDPVVQAAEKELQGLGPHRWEYHKGKLRDVSGHRAGSLEIMFDNVMDRFVGSWDRWVQAGMAGPGRKARVLRYIMARVGGRTGWFGNPRQTRLSSIAGLMTQNLIVATLGWNLGSAIKNVSQLLNTAASEGVPTTFRGVYRMALAGHRLGGKRGSRVLVAAGGRSEILADIREDLRLRAAYRRITYDDVWNLGVAGRSRFVDWMLTPFNAVENVMRGIAANVAGERMLRAKGVHTVKQWRALSRFEREQVIQFAREGAIDTNFLYGIAGRSHLMMHPVARAGFALQSYSWKEAEFIARSWARDGSAPIRLWAMHGWLLDMLDRAAGINAENWLGWGFLPPSGFVPNSPIVSTIDHLMGAMQAAGLGDTTTLDLEVGRLRGGVREIFRMFGLDPNNAVETQAILGGMTTAGLIPVPVIAIAKSARALYAFQTGALESGSGRSWIPVTRADAIKSAFFTLHAQAEDRRLRSMERVLRGKVDRELDRRTQRFVDALGSQDGPAVLDAATRLYDTIEVSVPLQTGPWGFVGDERQFWPHPEMIESRIRHAIARRVVSGPVLEMLDSGWAFEVLWAEYIKGALRAIELGGIRGFGK